MIHVINFSLLEFIRTLMKAKMMSSLKICFHPMTLTKISSIRGIE